MKPATQWANNADVFLVVGTSLVVQPVASLPSRAKSRGSRLIIINQEETPLDAQADVILKGRAGEILPQLAKAVLSERQTSI
jgi:NAD-dependent deacetylase